MKYLVDRDGLLEKFPGKGGWTYLLVPEVPPDPQNYFGQVRVKGYIDGVEVKERNLMPLGNGTLFLPVNGTIRKTTGKSAGDVVRLRLTVCRDPFEA